MKRLPLTPFLQVCSLMAIGRCHARLGRTGDAEDAFTLAISEAHRCELFMFEFIAHREFIEHVLDAQGRREEQLAVLGACINNMAMAPAAYTELLLSLGLDADDIVEKRPNS